MSDTAFISLGVTLAVLLGGVILINGGWIGFVVYLIVLALIFGFAG